jgi:transcription elongation factor Elf1
MKEYIIFECKNCGAKYIAEVPKVFRPYEITHMVCPRLN